MKIINMGVLGLRLAVAGGRDGLARLVLTALGVGLGITMLLLSLAGTWALEARAAKHEWRDSNSQTPATAPDATLWLAVSDHYAGEPLFRLHVAQLGPRPPVPPGLAALPKAGEVAVSPALRRLLEVTPRDQLGDRFPGRVVAVIGDAALEYPEQLMAVIGHTEQDLRARTGAQEVRGIQTTPPGDYAFTQAGRALLTSLAILMLVPLVVFVVMVTRIAAARREQRFAVLRLAGATRTQTTVAAVAETAVGTLAGTLLGLLGYALGLPVLARHMTHGGVLFFQSDLAVPYGQLLLVLAGVPVLAMAAAAVAAHRVRMTPLGIGRRARRARPTAWQAAPAVIGAAGLGVAAAFRDLSSTGGPFLLCLLIGSVVAGPWLCLLAGRAMARYARRATTLMAARRIAADPHGAFRGAGGAMLAVCIATFVAGVAASAVGALKSEPYGARRPGVVEIFVGSQPAEALAPLITDQAVVLRANYDGASVVSCADLARVVAVTCPLPGRVQAEGVRDDGAVRGIGYVSTLEPGADAAVLPVRTIFVPTDGTIAAEERVKTRAAVVMPRAILNTQRDVALQEARLWAEVNTLVRITAWFVILLGGCGVTVGLVAGLIERRRPFALLRASGVPLGALRRILVLETIVPMAITAAMGVALGSLASFEETALTGGEWSPPGLDFAVGLGAGMLAALAITTVALPLLAVTTRHNAVRYE